jgi:MFS family permease
VALVALAIALVDAMVLTTLAGLHLLTPNLLLVLTFAVGCGTALMGPAWASAVSEQVAEKELPAAVALNGISYNIARSIGPAVGGVVVATVGTVATFALNALCYLPLMAALLLWNRVAPRSHLPPEELSRAMVSGVRYVANSPSIQIVLVRSLVTGIIGGVIVALMPLIASDLLHSGARIYGLLLSAFGLGAVIGAVNIAQVRRRLSSEAAIRGCMLVMGMGIAGAALSRDPALTAGALLVAGLGWTMSWTLFNVAVQLSVPRWVVGRSLAAYQAASSGGIAIGSWGWGHLTNAVGVQAALLVAAVLMLMSPMLGVWLRMPNVRPQGEVSHEPEDTIARAPLAGHKGPVVVELEYRVSEQDAKEFYDLMQEVQLSRQRNGAYSWSVARDIADPQLWIERFHCPTWHEYLRHRLRATHAELALQQQAIDLHVGPGKVRVRRMLERPFG